MRAIYKTIQNNCRNGETVNIIDEVNMSFLVMFADGIEMWTKLSELDLIY